MQLDSHHRFVKDWDTKCIKMLHESDAGELQFFHPVATKITRDSREETSGASPRQPVPGEIQKIFNFVVPRFRAFLDP